jgi:predicted ATPase/DNA-binding SARP family transcriptional activator
MAGKLELRVLGAPEVRLNRELLTGFRSAKAEALLYYLCVTGQAHTRLALAGLLWGQWPDSQALVNLSQTLSNLRRLLGDHLEVSRDIIGWRRQSDYWLDVESLCVVVEKPIHELDAETLRHAVEHYRGDFLEGFYVRDAPEFEEWMLRERARWREGVLHALAVLAGQQVARGQWEEAVGLLRRIVALEPWREEVHRQLMWLLARAGQRSAALAQYEICRRQLAEELDVEPSQETETLYQRIRQGEIGKEAPTGFPGEPAYTPALPPHNLPAQLTPFVGRTNEVEQIVHRLSDPDCRLLTLVGPGGIGKTRLALKAAQQLLAEPADATPFVDGIFFVSLVSVATPAAMVSAIAGAVGFQFYSDTQPHQQLLNYLQTKRMLLVLDNLEQLLDGVDLISSTLANAQGVTILATSREALKLREEWFHPIAGMEVPQADVMELDRIAESDAVQLFVQNARQARAGFSLEAEQAHVVRICRLVDGTPLAIELAAGWLKAISCSQIVHEVERNLDILATQLHNVPARHRSMRVVLEQSWELLTKGEQEILKRLAVFRGGFRQEAAAQIAGASLVALVTFMEKSMLLVSERERYQLHELLRQFAEEKLVADPLAADATRTKHSLYYLNYLKQWGSYLTGREQEAALAAIGAELDNVRVGWQWAVETQQLEVLEQTLDSLYNFYQIRSRYHEGEELLGQLLDALQTIEKAADAQPPTLLVNLLVKTLSRRGALCQYLGEYEAAAQFLGQALAVASASGDHEEMAFAHKLLGQVAVWQGHKEEARAHLRSSLAICRESGDQRGLADALGQLANLFYATFGDYAEAKRLAGESLAISRELGRPDWIAYALDTLGFATFALGEYDASLAYYQEGLALFEEIGDQHGMALTLGGIGMVNWALGGERLAEARQVFERSLAHCRKIGHQGQVSGRLGGLARVANDQGEYQEALRYGKEGLAIARSLNSPVYIAHNLYCLTETACGLNDLQSGRRYLWEGLQIADKAQLFSNQTIYLYYYALILAKESNLAGVVAPARPQAQVQALETLALVRRHPACWQLYKERAAQLRDRIARDLPAQVVAAAEKRGATLALEDLVAEILAGSPN